MPGENRGIFEVISDIPKAAVQIIDSSEGLITLGFIGLAALLLIFSFLIVMLCIPFASHEKLEHAFKYSYRMLAATIVIAFLHFGTSLAATESFWKSIHELTPPQQMTVYLGLHTETWETKEHGKLIVPDHQNITEKKVRVTVSPDQDILIDASSVIKKIQQLQTAIVQQISRSPTDGSISQEDRATLGAGG